MNYTQYLEAYALLAQMRDTIPYATPAHRDSMQHIAELFVAELTGAEAMLQALLEELAAGEAPETVLLEAAQSVNCHRDEISAMLEQLQGGSQSDTPFGDRHDLH